MLPVKNASSYINPANDSEEQDVIMDSRYIRKSCSLITEALQKGCDVMQMPNGDVIITEVKTFTFQYSWDEKKGKMVRVQSGGRLRKSKAHITSVAEKVAMMVEVAEEAAA